MQIHIHGDKFQMNGPSKSNGSWQKVTPSQMKRFIALLLYQELVQVSLYHVLWA